MSRLDILKKHYDQRIDKYSDTSQVLDWESKEAQFKRFTAMTDNIYLKGKILLDVGCGCGDFFGMIKDMDEAPTYIGVDILEKMVNRATNEYPDGSFFCADIFKEGFDFKEKLGFCNFDICFASGIFNLQAGNNEIFLKKAVPILANISTDVFVFNLLDPSSLNADERYFYYPSQKAIDLASPFAKKIDLINGYLDNDYTLICRK